MDIKVIGICGSPVKGGNTEVFLRKSLEAAESTGGTTTVLITLADKVIKDCNQCNWCFVKQEEGKFCAQKDDMTEIYTEILTADAVFLASPAYIGRMSGLMACMVDRLRALLVGQAYHGKLRNKVGSALAVAWGRNAGVETTLLSLMSAVFILEMIPVGSLYGPGASTFGVAGLSSEHGTGKFNPAVKLGVLNDEFGIKGAQNLGKRVADVAKLIKAGKAAINK